jgi:neuromedin U receptor 1
VKNQFLEHSFEISSFLFFIVPMAMISVLYVLIGLKLRKSKMLYDNKGKGCDSQRCIKGQTRVVRMLGEPINEKKKLF